jgi:hypothetical protein
MTMSCVSVVTNNIWVVISCQHNQHNNNINKNHDNSRFMMDSEVLIQFALKLASRDTDGFGSERFLR